MSNEVLAKNLNAFFKAKCQDIKIANNEITMEVAACDIVSVCEELKNQPDFLFAQLMDLCVVDYLHYGLSQWATDTASSCGFERGVRAITDTYPESQWTKSRFAVVYHLLSIEHNQRLRIKAFVPDYEPMIDSVVGVWNVANWYEREAFDLYGVLFNNHPDLRRLLTDYGFIGYPFRKDFPLIGEVEPHYDGTQKRVVYAPVDIEPRTLVPKVIRKAQDEEQVVGEQVHGGN